MGINKFNLQFFYKLMKLYIKRMVSLFYLELVIFKTLKLSIIQPQKTGLRFIFFAGPPLVFLQNDIRGTSAEIPYSMTSHYTQIWVVMPHQHHQTSFCGETTWCKGHAYSNTGCIHVVQKSSISLGGTFIARFTCSFFRKYRRIAAFLHIDSTCAFHLRLSETTTPNSYADETTSICLSLIVI